MNSRAPHAPTRPRPDWTVERERIDLAAVATSLLGPAPGRCGEGGRKLWWSCPFHEDRNPSLCVEPGKPWWKCYGCDAKGDAVALVRLLNPSMTFPEAVVFLAGGPAPASAPRPHPRPPDRPPDVVRSGTEGMPEAGALALVADAEIRLWSPEGMDALTCLHERGLSDETIRAARLGWSPRIEARSKDGNPYTARGIVIPWFDDLERPTTIYPNRRVIQPGRPLAIVEGEADALLLEQELADLAVSVVTLGSASARPDPDILRSMLAAPVWFVATDNDPAGDKAASGWPVRGRNKIGVGITV